MSYEEKRKERKLNEDSTTKRKQLELFFNKVFSSLLSIDSSKGVRIDEHSE